MSAPAGWRSVVPARPGASRRTFGREHTVHRPGRAIGAVVVVVVLVAGWWAWRTPPALGIAPPPETEAVVDLLVGDRPLDDRPAGDRRVIEEAAETGLGYRPFLGFGDGDVDGDHVHVEDGVRRSYEPAADGADLPIVWFFGGTAMFGVGQRDEHTIPSEVARLAEADGVPVRVVNFGQRGGVNWQATLRYLEQATSVPADVVVFYDGYDDVVLGEQRRSWTHDTPDRPSHLLAGVGADVQRELQALRGDPVAASDAGPARSVEAAARYVRSNYRRGVELAAALGPTYGHDVVHFWQPSAFTKRLHPVEQRLLDDPAVSVRRALSDAVVRDLPPGVIDLGAALDDEPDPVLVDAGTTDEAGAAAVARAMYRVVRPLLPATDES